MSVSSKAAEDTARRPNFLIFCTDEHQAACLGCNGNALLKTPNIDRIAASGVSFSRAYCNNPVCMPSRATLFTGLTPRQHGCISNGVLLPQSVPTLPGALADAGYRTHAIGKLHLQPFRQGLPAPDGGKIVSLEDRWAWDSGTLEKLPLPYYGFQSVDFAGGHVHYIFGDYARWLEREHPGMRERYLSENATFRPDGAPGCWHMPIPAELHYNQWIADRAVNFLGEQTADRPFFLWCSFPDPHFPFAASAPYNRMYDPADMQLAPTHANPEHGCSHLWNLSEASPKPRDFTAAGLRHIVAQTYGMISHVDHCVGQVMSAMESRGLDRNTVVVFISDHGEYLGAHQLLYKGDWPYEELWRVPCIWRPPVCSPLAAARQTVVSHLDMVPTILDYAGLRPEVLAVPRAAQAERPVLPGRNLRPMLEGADPPEHRPALVEYDEDRVPGRMSRTRGLVSDRYKLVIFSQAGEGLLFDLLEDPHETRNLYDEPALQAVKAELLERLVCQLAQSDRLDLPRICGA